MAKTKPAKPAIKPPTAAEIRHYKQLNGERLEARRKADALERDFRDCEARLLAFTRMGKTKKATIGGYELSIEKAAGSVYWKGAFIEHNGQEAADQLIAAAPARDKLVVNKAA